MLCSFSITSSTGFLSFFPGSEGAGGPSPPLSRPNLSLPPFFATSEISPCGGPTEPFFFLTQGPFSPSMRAALSGSAVPSCARPRFVSVHAFLGGGESFSLRRSEFFCSLSAGFLDRSPPHSSAKPSPMSMVSFFFSASTRRMRFPSFFLDLMSGPALNVSATLLARWNLFFAKVDSFFSWIVYRSDPPRHGSPFRTDPPFFMGRSSPRRLAFRDASLVEAISLFFSTSNPPECLTFFPMNRLLLSRRP